MPVREEAPLWLQSGNLWTARGRRHECNLYCRAAEGVHAYVGYHTSPLAWRSDTREACRLKGYELVDMWETTEAPLLGEILQPSGKPARVAMVVLVRRQVA